MTLTPKSPISKHLGIPPSFCLVDHRCLLIARAHTILKDHISALALCERAQSCISKIPSSLGSFPEKAIPVSTDDVSSLSDTLEGEMTRSHAHVILSQPNLNESLTAQKVSPSLKQS